MSRHLYISKISLQHSATRCNTLQHIFSYSRAPALALCSRYLYIIAFRGYIFPERDLQLSKKPLIIGLFCGKWPVKITHSVGLHQHIVLMLVGILNWMVNSLLSCRLFFAKKPRIIGLFCGKWPIKIRHLMGLHHPLSCALPCSLSVITA